MWHLQCESLSYELITRTTLQLNAMQNPRLFSDAYCLFVCIIHLLKVTSEAHNTDYSCTLFNLSSSAPFEYDPFSTSPSCPNLRDNYNIYYQR